MNEPLLISIAVLTCFLIFVLLIEKAKLWVKISGVLALLLLLLWTVKEIIR
jgi:hypothetical protein